MPAKGEDEREEARLFYVEATRATASKTGSPGLPLRRTAADS